MCGSQIFGIISFMSPVVCLAEREKKHARLFRFEVFLGGMERERVKRFVAPIARGFNPAVSGRFVSGVLTPEAAVDFFSVL